MAQEKPEVLDAEQFEAEWSERAERLQYVQSTQQVTTDLASLLARGLHQIAVAIFSTDEIVAAVQPKSVKPRKTRHVITRHVIKRRKMLPGKQ